MPVFSEADTRSSLSSVMRLSWEAGDNLRVFNYSRGKMMTGGLTADSSGKTSRFSGELSGELAATDSLLLALIQVNLNTIPLVEGADSLFYGAMVTGVNPVISFSSEGGKLIETVSAKCYPEEGLEFNEIVFFYAEVDENNVPTTDVEPIKLPETASLTLFLTCPRQEKAERSVVVYADGSSYIADFTAAEIRSGFNYFTGNKSVFQDNDVTVDGDEGGDV